MYFLSPVDGTCLVVCAAIGAALDNLLLNMGSKRHVDVSLLLCRKDPIFSNKCPGNTSRSFHRAEPPFLCSFVGL